MRCHGAQSSVALCGDFEIAASAGVVLVGKIALVRTIRVFQSMLLRVRVVVATCAHKRWRLACTALVDVDSVEAGGARHAAQVRFGGDATADLSKNGRTEHMACCVPDLSRGLGVRRRGRLLREHRAACECNGGETNA
jgi:hypothetical protein